MKKKTPKGTPLKVLYLEDSPHDIELVQKLLEDTGYDLNMGYTEKKKEFTSLLQNNTYDVILSDFKLPGFDAFEALRIAQEIRPEVPFICISGSIGEETAIEIIKQGAIDYVLKDRMARLPAAIKRSLEEVKEKNARRQAEESLRVSEEIFRQFMDHSPVYVFFKDEDIRPIRLSKNFEKMVGKPLEEMLGKNMYELFPSKLAKSMVEDDKRILKEGKEIIVDEELNGRYYTTIKFPINIKGKPRYLAGYTIDVTERKQAEENLKASEKRFRDIAENAQEWIWEIDAEGKYTYINQVVEKIIGYTSEEVLQKHFYDFFHPEDRETLKAAALAAFATKQPFQEFINRNVHKNGQTVWLATSGFPLIDDKGNLIGYRGVDTDITKRKQAEEYLRKSETDLNEAMKIAKLGTWEYDVASDQFTFNDQFYKLFNTTAKREGGYIMPSAQYAQKFVHPDDMYLVGKETQKALDTTDPDYYMQLDHRIIRADGEIGYITVHIRIQKDAKGRTVKTYGVNQDITDRKRAEEALNERDIQFSKLAAQIPGMIYQFLQKPDGKFCVPFTSDGIRDIFGCLPQDVRDDFSPIAKVILPEDLNIVVNSIKKSGEQLTPWRCEYRVKLPDQPIRWLYGQSMPEKLNDGSIMWHGFNTDITERKIAEEIIRQSENQFKNLFMSMSDGFYISEIVYDAEGNPCDYKYVEVNPTFEKIMGLTRDQIIGKRFKELVPVDTTGWLKNYFEVASTGLSKAFEFYSDEYKKYFETYSYQSTKDQVSVFVRDITGRKQAEKALIESQLLYHSFIEQLPNAVFRKDKEGRYILVNSQFCALKGLKKEDFIGRKPMEVAANEMKRQGEHGQATKYAKTGEDSHEQIMRTGKILETEEEYPIQDGRVQYMHVMRMPVFDSQGTVVGTQGIMFDITDRKIAELTSKQAEKALQDSIERYKNLTKISPVGIFHTDESGSTTYVNPKWCQISGLSFEDALGDEWLRAIHPDDKEKISNGWQMATRFHKASFTEYRFVHPDGTIRWVMGQAIPETNSENKIVGYIGTITDITERVNTEKAVKRNEERLKDLFETAPVGYHEIDTLGNITAINQTELKMLGYSFEEMIGWPIWEFTANVDESRKRVLGKLAGTLPPNKNFEQNYCRRDETCFPAIVDDVILRNEQGAITGIRTTILDITDRKKADEELRQTRDYLENLLSFANAPIMVWDQDNKITRFNLSFEKLTGYSIYDVVGKNLEILFLAETRNGLTNLLSRIINGENLLDIELPVLCKNGSIRIVSWNTANIYSADGSKIMATIAHGRDITDRKKAEEALQKSEKQFRMLFEQMTSGFAVHEIILNEKQQPVDYRFLQVNTTFEKLTGLKAKDILGKTVLELLPKTEKYFIERYGEVALSGKDIQFESFSQEINKYYDIHAYAPERGKFATIFEDITERKRIEEALIYERNLLKSLMDNTPDHIYFKDTSSRFIRMSKAQSRRFNLSDSALAIGKTDFDFFSEEHAKQAFENEQKIIKTGTSMENFEEKETWVDGSITWVSTTKVPLRDTNGQIIGTFGISRDITKRKRTENELREKEVQYHNLADSGTALIWTSGIDKLCNYFNEPWLKFTGRSLEQEIGNGWTEGVHPDDLDRCVKTYVTAFDKREAFEMDYRLRHNSGEYRWIQDMGKPNYDNSGEFIGYIGHCFDITERRQTEEALQESELRYRRLVEFSPDAIAVHCDGVFVYVNPAAVKLFGAKDVTQLEGKPILDIVHLESKELVRQRIMTGLKNGKPLSNIEEKFQKLDGTVIDVEVTSLPIVYKGKSAIQLIIRDISDKKKIQSHLLQTQKVQSIGTLAGGIAHDFNNILGIVLAYSSVLERNISNPKKITESVTAINSAVNRGAALVRQILTFARQTDVTIRPMSVPELAHEIVNMLQETFPKVIEFKEVFDRGIPLISADHTQMHQAILNLCVNARDAMPKGGTITIKIQIETLQKVAQRFQNATFDNYVCLSVTDTGIGMDEVTKSRIFDPFFTTKELGKGTGLGLSVVYGIMQSHYGFINVDSEVGNGTTFYLYLPVPQEFKKGKVESEIKSTDVVGGTESILFVEDEELLREVVQSTLEGNGYNVFVAADGQEAVEIYKKQFKDISLVLTDMGLPKMSGVDEFALLKKINPKVKVVFASGFITLDARSELLKEGVKGFIQKPYNVTEILRMVREILDEKGGE